MKKVTVLLGMLVMVAFTSSAWADLITIANKNHFWINVANDAGVKYNNDDTAAATAFSSPPTTSAPDNNSYYFSFNGGGLNALHVTTDAVNSVTGQLTTINSTSNSASGTFYITSTGGGGAAQDMLLMLSAMGPIPDNFSAAIKSSGLSYTGIPGSSTTEKIDGAVNETFNKSDFLYTSTGRPAGMNGFLSFNGSSPLTTQSIMFIDLGVETLDGPVQVDYNLSNLPSSVSFNCYGWSLTSNQKEGINWSNNTLSGYTINNLAPVPIPPAIFLFGSGLSGLFFFRRRSLAV